MNVLAGDVADAGLVVCGSLTLRAASSVPLARGARAVVCIRPQHLVLGSGDGAAVSAPNRAAGRIVRHTYLGELRDYLIDVEGCAQLRAITDPSVRYDVGATVTIDLPADRCRIVEA